MLINALIPVNYLQNAKTRLRQSLLEKKRHQLVLKMLNHVIKVLKSVSEIENITIISPDSKIYEFSKLNKVSFSYEKKHGLNEALSFEVKDYINQKLLVIFADLPYVNKGDIENMLLLLENNELVLAQSKDNGTNAILSNTPGQIPFLFGKNSFDKYMNFAKVKKIKSAVYKSTTIETDIDTPNDLSDLKSRKIPTYSFLT